MGVRYGRMFRGRELREYLHDSWRMFVATASSQVYVRGSMVILGFFATDVVLGQFATVHRIAGVLMTLVAPLAQAVFPHAAQLWTENRTAYFRLQRRLVGITIVVFV